ncbi:MAG TPA: dolichyl-phosphate beta-glucosyltransferase [Bryobacteraceae bacterium]|nr:dolichyl-phosphate beta-glucosyltransferase [Bryobacteraceae bacterium]
MRRSISIIIPAYNEERRLPSTLEAIGRYLGSRSWDFAEIVVVNDGSRDRTAALACATGARVIENPGNRGKGFSVRNGILKAEGEWLLFTDADLSSPIEELDKLWRMAENENAEVAIGSRALDRSLVGVHQPAMREFAGRLFNLVMRAVTGLPFHDTQCGFKLFQRQAAREIFRRQRLDGFGFDVEALYIASRLGYRVLEIPVRWNDVAGTKVSAARGLAAFADILHVRWNGFRGLYR